MKKNYLAKYLLDEPGVYVKNLEGDYLSKAAKVLAVIGKEFPMDLHDCLERDSLGVHIKRNPAGGVFIIASNGDTEVVFEDTEALPSEEFESVTLDIRHPDKSVRNDIHPMFDLIGSVSGYCRPLIKRGKFIPDEPGTAIGGGSTKVDLRMERLWEWSIKQKFAFKEGMKNNSDLRKWTYTYPYCKFTQSFPGDREFLVIDEEIKEAA